MGIHSHSLGHTKRERERERERERDLTSSGQVVWCLQVALFHIGLGLGFHSSPPFCISILFRSHAIHRCSLCSLKYVCKDKNMRTHAHAHAHRTHTHTHTVFMQFLSLFSGFISAFSCKTSY